MDFLCEGNAGLSVAAASWQKRGQGIAGLSVAADHTWWYFFAGTRAQRTTHWWDFILARGRRASLAHGPSGPSKDGILLNLGCGGSQILRGMLSRIMKKVMRMFLNIHDRSTTCSTMRLVFSALPPSQQELLVISAPLKLLLRSKAIHGDVCV